MATPSRLTIIRADNTVIIGGRAVIVDCSGLDQSIHAGQWYGARGEIEYVRNPAADPASYRPNRAISDLSGFQSVIDAWVATAARGVS